MSMTVGQLRERLSVFHDYDPVMILHDNGTIWDLDVGHGAELTDVTANNGSDPVVCLLPLI